MLKKMKFKASVISYTLCKPIEIWLGWSLSTAIYGKKTFDATQLTWKVLITRDSTVERTWCDIITKLWSNFHGFQTVVKETEVHQTWGIINKYSIVSGKKNIPLFLFCITKLTSDYITNKYGGHMSCILNVYRGCLHTRLPNLFFSVISLSDKRGKCFITRAFYQHSTIVMIRSSQL